MKRRTCPNCSEILGEYDSYFCSACGKKLPKELIYNPRSIRTKTYKLEESAKKGVFFAIKKFKIKKFLYPLLLIIFIGVVLFGIYSTGVLDLILEQYSDGSTEVSTSNKLKEDQEPILIDNITLKKGDFTKTNLSAYFPLETDFYFETFDINNPSNYFVDSEGLSELFTRSQVLFESSFAGGYLKDSDSWFFVFNLKDKVLVKKLIEDIENENWHFHLFDNVLIMTQNEKLLSEIKDVKNKVTPSLALNPTYVTETKNLSDTGAVKIVFMNHKLKANFNKHHGVLDGDIIIILEKVLNSAGYSFIIQ